MSSRESDAQVWRIERHPGQPGATYLIHVPTGRTVAYGPERDGPRPNLWIASLWSADPIVHDDAVHLRHLCVDATWQELQVAVDAWKCEPISG